LLNIESYKVRHVAFHYAQLVAGYANFTYVCIALNSFF